MAFPLWIYWVVCVLIVAFVFRYVLWPQEGFQKWWKEMRVSGPTWHLASDTDKGHLTQSWVIILIGVFLMGLVGLVLVIGTHSPIMYLACAIPWITGLGILIFGLIILKTARRKHGPKAKQS